MTSVDIEQADYLILGGGIAAATAAATLRADGAEGRIMMLSAEAEPPYDRPALSKAAFLGGAGRSADLVHPPGFYRDHGIDLRLNCRAVGVDGAARIVTTADGARIGYGKLLIATGARPRAPEVALPGVLTLRTRADAEAIRQAALGARRAIVLGGSFLGMEIAMSLVEMGLQTTIIERGPTLLYRLAAPSLSDRFRRHAEDAGARVLLNDTALRIVGEGHARMVETAAGERIPCDLVVVSIGVLPESEFLAGSGIALENGHVVVDEQLRASLPDVYAAGDVTSFFDPVFGKRRHIEHWDNAVKQGRLAARNMMGRRLRHDEVSYFYCEVGDQSFNVLGAPEEGPDHKLRGDPDSGAFAQFYLRDDVPRALFSMGRPTDETRTAEALIRYRVTLAPVRERLSDPAFPLDDLPTQTALILQGGGALGAFEAGVVRALQEAGVFPDIVAGVSIGALNGAVIASNPRNAAEVLEAFWAELAVVAPTLPFGWATDAAVAAQILTFGVPGFFRPRWMTPGWGLSATPAGWTSLYDTAPMRDLIARYVDFPSLRHSPVRLLVSAVDVATAELVIFDSYVDDLTPDHILASGSLPPGFPWTEIDGRAYWDGGIVSNSPLDLVAERCGPEGKRVFIVDLFSNHRPLPANLLEVMARRDEIVYAERVRNDLRQREREGAYRRLVEQTLARLEPAEAARMRSLPEFIQLMGHGGENRITRLIRAPRENEAPSRDYDFSEAAVRAHMAEGYAAARQALEQDAAEG